MFTRPGLCVLLVSFQLAASGVGLAGPLPPEWVERWRADLAFATDSLPRAHPNWFHTLQRERYRAALDSLSAAIPCLQHHEIVVGLARIVALVGDGHTRLTFPFDSTAGFFSGHASTAPHRIPGLVFRHYPIRYRVFSDGLYVIRADSAHRELLGGRVIRIGSRSVEEARAAVEPVIHRDNDRQMEELLPAWLACPEILHARGVAADLDQLPVVIEHRDGVRRTGLLRPAMPGTSPRWMEAREPGPLPLRDRSPERPHWFLPVPGSRAIYARYREVRDGEEESVAEFARRLFARIESSRAERLVIDLRGNLGGNGFLNRPLIQGLIRAERLWRPGGLCALIDGGTFSAAVMLAADLEMMTPTLLIGEKSGGRPNSYGDSRRIVLPNTGITVRVSSLFWQTTDPRDHRDGIAPHLQVETRFEDWQRNRDPALDSALALGGLASDAVGTWSGRIGWQFERLPVRLEIAARDSPAPGFVICDAAGLDHAPLKDVRQRRGEVSARWDSRSGPWTFAGRSSGHHMVGLTRFKGCYFPVILERVSAPLAPDKP
jgi:hypothetical protein